MDLCKVFEDTRNKSNNELKTDTDKLINNTIVYSDRDYDEYSIIFKKNKNKILNIEFNTNDTVTEICKDKNIHTAALSFADAATPGGSVLYGAKTQEECLCRCSNLYESIISEKCDKEFYSKNLSNYHNTRNIIYSPDCTFFLDKDYIPLKEYTIIHIFLFYFSFFLFIHIFIYFIRIIWFYTCIVYKFFCVIIKNRYTSISSTAIYTY